MQTIHTPRLDARYWLAILFASIFGTNLGDLYAHESGLGIVVGLIVLAAIAAGGFLLERKYSAPTELFYWFVIAIIRTGATNIADFLSFRAHPEAIALPLWMALWTVLFGVLVALFGRRAQWIGGDGATQQLRADAGFWLAMLSAGIFGTILGDICSHNLGGGLASLALLAALGLALVWRQRVAGSIMAVWLVVAIARTAGTAVGDWLAESEVTGLGLPLATLITGACFIAIVALRPRRPSPPVAAV